MDEQKKGYQSEKRKVHIRKRKNVMAKSEEFPLK